MENNPIFEGLSGFLGQGDEVPKEDGTKREVLKKRCQTVGHPGKKHES